MCLPPCPVSLSASCTVVSVPDPQLIPSLGTRPSTCSDGNPVCFFPNAVKSASDPTSDEPTSDAVETTAAEAVLTDHRESMEGQQH